MYIKFLCGLVQLEIEQLCLQVGYTSDVWVKINMVSLYQHHKSNKNLLIHTLSGRNWYLNEK